MRWWCSGAIFHCVASNLSIMITAWQLCPLDSDAGQVDITEGEGPRNATGIYRNVPEPVIRTAAQKMASGSGKTGLVEQNKILSSWYGC